MGIYDVNGNQLSAVYDVSGNSLQTAYDVDGNLIFTSEINLKVMTYNCGRWYTGTGVPSPTAYAQLYYDLQHGMIARNDPDILCVEEYGDLMSVDGVTAVSMLYQYYPYFETRRGDTDYWGHAIFSKYPIVSYTENHYSNESVRYYDKATINANGHTINVVVTHLSTDADKRPVQSAELLTYANTLANAIVCGDFNLHCHSKDYYYEYREKYEWIEGYKPWVDADYNMANNDDQFGFIDTYFSSSDNPLTMGWWSLDNIIVSPNIVINDVYTDRAKVTDPITSDPNWLIDHIPLIAEITV